MECTHYYSHSRDKARESLQPLPAEAQATLQRCFIKSIVLTVCSGPGNLQYKGPHLPLCASEAFPELKGLQVVYTPCLSHARCY